MKHIATLKRIRENKTDYKKRKAILVGRHTFASIRLSNENVLVQMIRPEVKGDRVLVSAHSRELLRYGWKGSRKSMPACYLVGLLAGKKALSSGIDSCIVYTGLRGFTPRVASCTKGLIDAGMDVRVDEDSLPDEDRIEGKHIAEYASVLNSEDKDTYKSRFSQLLSNGLRPEDYVEHFKEVKSKILNTHTRSDS